MDIHADTATGSIDNTEVVAADTAIATDVIPADTVEIVNTNTDTTEISALNNTAADSAAISDSATVIAQEEPESKPDIAVYVAGNLSDNGPRIKISAGAGGLIGLGFGGGITWPGGERIKMPYTATGVYLFLDAVFAEAFLGGSDGNGKWESPNAPDPKNLPDMPRLYINAGLFAKYPFEFYRHTKLFPLLGLDYAASISGKLKLTDKKEYTLDGANGHPEANALSSLWFKAGGGIDFDIGKAAYLRSELIYGLRGANTFEKFCADNTPSNVNTNAGHGLDFKIGVGAKF